MPCVREPICKIRPTAGDGGKDFGGKGFENGGYGTVFYVVEDVDGVGFDGLAEVDDGGGQAFGDVDEIGELRDDVLAEGGENLRDVAVLDVCYELFGLLFVGLEGLDGATGDFGKVFADTGFS